MPLCTVWFKKSEYEITYGVVNMFVPVGIALSYLPSSLLFRNVSNVELLARNLAKLLIGSAVVHVIVYLLVVVLIREKPSKGVGYFEEGKENSNTHSLSELICNKNFVLLTISVGLIYAIEKTMFIIVNQSLFQIYTEASDMVTTTGIFRGLSGIPGTLIASFYLKSSRKFQLTTILFLILVIVGAAFNMLSLFLSNIVMIYFSSILLGFSVTGAVPLMFNYVIEVSFPYPESKTMGILAAVAASPTLFCTPLATSLIENYGAINGNGVLLVFAIAALILACFVKEDLRRHRADETLPFLN
ncbi:feline leukemia virus subgroup C receptor-related protein 2-like isoform X2 [Dinothrombium tinctorium]|uniref:Feline leukemia virus subgroup C receptor-related protein 2-like isoform X2 n=1 Tax=Dinothrombium tinctorium TaxID=1965070 RepID=A0A3S4QCJ8_9ACAR|nr:feline leukemia virus subgroup C receptor-related protein 2-like isoform X2 [Dinothrombium tinctorium]